MLIDGALSLTLSAALRLDHVAATANALVVQVVSTQVVSACPLCGHASDQIPGRSRCVVSDVPCGNRPVRLQEFFCRTASCPRKFFTECLPDLVPPSARLTNGLRLALQAVGVATGGEVSVRLAPQGSMPVTPGPLLRCLRALSSSPAPPVRIVGLDAWASKRGSTYGTIVLEWERHQVIDRLPDRSSDTVKVWLQGHPEIEVMSRDRASSYADKANDSHI